MDPQRCRVRLKLAQVEERIHIAEPFELVADHVTNYGVIRRGQCDFGWVE